MWEKNIEILNFMKKVYFEKFQTELEIPVIHSDCEDACLNLSDENILKKSWIFGWSKEKLYDSIIFKRNFVTNSLQRINLALKNTTTDWKDNFANN